mgnify:CR=1 FL=1|jgi:hypothetical protein
MGDIDFKQVERRKRIIFSIITYTIILIVINVVMYFLLNMG